MNLEFKQIPGYSSYRINRLGKVWSDIRNKFMKMNKRKNGYLQISLVNDEGNRTATTIHQLLAMAFLNHKPDGHKIVVDHIDRNPLNNRIENLQLVSNRENCSKDKHYNKKSGLPLGITTNNSSYRYVVWYNSKQFKWGFHTLEQAIEMKETFESLTEFEGLEYAVNTLDANRRSGGRMSKAELNGDIIKIG